MTSSAAAQFSASIRRASGEPMIWRRKPARTRCASPIRTLSNTDSPLKIARFWNVRATPCAANRAVGTWAKARSPSQTRPRSGR
ncbi:hypothetical protein ACVILL_001371 [Bradyrhizobium sp. USDA 3364]